MRNYTKISDIGNIENALKEAKEIKKNPYADKTIGKDKTLLMLFFNSSLRTRISTQKAALNLGMNVIVFDINEGGWSLETEFGVIMDGDKPEHIREAVPVIGRYCDIIAVRSFARFESREADYAENILNQFVEFAGVPVVSMESATRHPLQTLADILTIDEYKTKEKPKVVLTWAPHPKSLPQAVANSFAEGMQLLDVDFVITHPEGYELAEKFTANAKIEHDQKKAFENADFIYAKNWSSYQAYGEVLNKDRSWTVDAEKMELTNNAKFMHCLPVRRNMVVTDEVIDSENSIVLDEAENRLYAAQLVLKRILQTNK